MLIIDEKIFGAIDVLDVGDNEFEVEKSLMDTPHR